MRNVNSFVRFVVIILALGFLGACNAKNPAGNTPVPQPGAEPAWTTLLNATATPVSVVAASRTPVTAKGEDKINQNGLNYTATWVLMQKVGDQWVDLKIIMTFTGTTQMLSGPVGWTTDVSIPTDYKPGDYQVELRRTESLGDKSHTSKIAAPFTITPKA